MTRFTPPATPKLAGDAEIVRRETEAKLVEIQRAALAIPSYILGIELEDGVETPVAHKLGRAPRFVRESCVRGAVTTGHVEEVRGTNDRAKTVILKASNWGATITIDLQVVP